VLKLVPVVTVTEPRLEYFSSAAPTLTCGFAAFAFPTA